jgi:hypothetical protein
VNVELGEKMDNADESHKDNAINEISPHKSKGSNTCSTLVKVVRAVSATVIFGIPLTVGTAAVLGYGGYRAYKAIKG